MPESPNQASSGQRRANWVALRTLRQLPNAVGETAGGEPIYEVRSVHLLLDSPAGNFVRLAECSRCGRQLAGAPVRTTADLDRPVRPMICSDCIRSAGVATVWASKAGEPAAERPAPATLAANDPDPTAAAPGEAQRPDRLQVMEGHLRAVTDRVNELGRVARAQHADFKERTRREEVAAATLGDELAALRASAEETRAALQGLAQAQAELERLAATVADLERRSQEGAPAADAGAGLAQLRDEVAQLARLVEAQRGEVVGFVAGVGETQIATAKLAAAQEELAETLAGFDPSKVEELITTRLAEAADRPPAEVDLTKVEELIATRLADAEARLAHQISTQWGDLETAIQGSVTASMAGFERAREELAGGQAVLEERIDVLADQASEASWRAEALLHRLAALEAAARPVDAPPDSAAKDGPAGSFLDSLDRQLGAAARRLAARSQAGAGRLEP